jgi:predicted ATPase
LPQDAWSSEKDLVLRLYTIATEMELALGNIVSMEKYSKEVLSQQTCSAIDKVPVYLAWCHKAANVDSNQPEVVNVCIHVLQELGEKSFRYRSSLSVRAIASFLKTVRRAKKCDRSFYLALKPVSDVKHEAIIDMLSRLSTASYLTHDGFIQIMSVTRMVNMTLDYGIFKSSGVAFSMLGLLTNVMMKDATSAAHFADMALLMQDKCTDKSGKATTIFVSYSFVYPWSRPIGFPRSDEGYKSGMLTGNVEYGLWCKCCQVSPFAWGRPFEHTMFNVLPDLVVQCTELKQETHEVSIRLYWQAMLNLSGNSENRLELSGEVFDPHNNALGALPKCFVVYLELLLRVLFGEWELALQKALELGEKFGKDVPCQQEGMLEAFLRSITYYKVARVKRKYKRHAKKPHKTLLGWMKNGNPNVKHFCCLLDAEKAALCGKTDEANKLYKEATAFAARTGMLHIAGLSNECYAEFLRKDMKDNEEAQYRLVDATRFYRSWGAHAKVELLIDEHGLLRKAQ